MKDKQKEIKKMTITLTPDYLKIRREGHNILIKITNEQALGYLSKWRLPMNAFMDFDLINIEDQEYIKERIKKQLENVEQIFENKKKIFLKD